VVSDIATVFRYADRAQRTMLVLARERRRLLLTRRKPLSKFKV